MNEVIDGWYNYGEMHTLPIRDKFEHDRSELCACHPRIVIENDMVKLIIHNSFDKREQTEPDRLRVVEKAVEQEIQFHIQDEAKQVKSIPWGLAEILFPAYGSGQSLKRLDERGGFGRMELGLLACDGYVGGMDGKPRPKLLEMPLLTLYKMAKENQ